MFGVLHPRPKFSNVSIIPCGINSCTLILYSPTRCNLPSPFSDFVLAQPFREAAAADLSQIGTAEAH